MWSINLSRLLVLVTILRFAVYANCNKKTFCSQQLYSFSINIQTVPDLDSVHINDTIWFTSNSPVNLIDNMSQTVINFSGASNLGTVTQFLKFIGGSVTDPGVTPAANNFDVVLINGVVVTNPINPEKNREFRFEQSQNRYLFKLGVIPKFLGTYSIAITDAANVYRAENECDKANFSITFSNTNQHLYFYEQNRPGYTPSLYETSHMYCFKVVP